MIPFSPLYLLDECRYFDGTDDTYSLPGPHDTDDVEKATGSKIKVSQRWPQKSCEFAEALKGCASELTQILPELVRVQVHMGSKVKVTETLSGGAVADCMGVATIERPSARSPPSADHIFCRAT